MKKSLLNWMMSWTKLIRSQEIQKIENKINETNPYKEIIIDGKPHKIIFKLPPIKK